jgi:hypothetical protein
VGERGRRERERERERGKGEGEENGERWREGTEEREGID